MMRWNKVASVFLGLCMTVGVMAADFASDRFLTPAGKELIITFVRHGSLAMSYAGKQIQIDPVSEYADYSAFPKADLILVCHAHGDHLDLKAIEALKKEETTVIANPAAAEQVKQPQAQVMRNGDTMTWQGVKIEAVPAYNTTEGRDKFHPKGRDNGYVLDFDGFRVYVAGDTEDIPELSSLKAIDVAFLPVNQPYTMTPEQAAHAARVIQPKVFYPYHYSQTPVAETLPALLEGSGVELRIRALQ
ncbi:MAG: MBL fold metallo-hydrolase [Parabacteroides sp.]